jgi:hypothetical protein
MAAGVITTGSLPKLLWPGLQELFGVTYDQHPKTYPMMFDTVKSDKAYEEYVQVTGFGIGQYKPQGQSISYDSQQQGFTTRLTNAAYALGYIVTEEEIEDNLYPKIAQSRTRSLAFSMLQAKEVNTNAIYNRAFTSGYTGGDGVVLCSTAHPNVAGGTQANTPTVASDLSEASYEDALIAIKGFTDDKGLLINVKAKNLIVARQEWYNALRLTKSVYQPGTANNDINATLMDNSVPGGAFQSVYLTSPHAWFIRTNAGGDGHGLIFQERTPLKFFQDNEFDTRNMKAGAMERYVAGWDDWRGVWGNNGP